MANENEAIEQGLNAAEAEAESGTEQQKVEQLASQLENSANNNEESRMFPGAQ